MNVCGRVVTAMKPPLIAPRPIPRFIMIRCIANAEWRRSAGASPAISDDWAGQNVALPIPATALARKPCHGWWTQG